MKMFTLLSLACAVCFAPVTAQTSALDAADTSDGVKARSVRHAQLVKKADDAAEARRKRSQDGAGAIAGFDEAKYRLLAALMDGKVAVPAEVVTLAEQSIQSGKLQRREAFELARLVAAAKTKTRKFPSAAAWREAKEREAVELWRAFPDLPDAAAALLARAAWAEPKRMSELAAQVEVSAPDRESKARAQLLGRRAALDGANLFAVLSSTEGGLALAKEFVGQPVIFYTWSPGDANGLAELTKVLSRAPKRAGMVGLAVGAGRSHGTPSAKLGANLPGRQLYGGRGDDSPLAQRLTLTEPGLILICDSAGTMRLLRTDASPAATLANLR